ncbi:hypothetical protein BST36_12430 [Mycolicibacterium moriokaense]|jgi:hypothetical protein|uniref:Secreted protein n=1 Tax=Mycolicibacterium moriokaense TaxID=39691 RepID=A0AAD1H994_9MYCO|nr:hypothetical protein [Mycolicibacterium moriokaense]MCV7042664.1 hypothetical protein [Mycolicibacterium moriokaense]ORB23425.1 hypothetical protein BST36_12430 [Mycolicibacterium moriokaense]BBX01213.1 hypothetical protein MMOR_21490 [Mycolicibacterium moriokaense]
MKTGQKVIAFVVALAAVFAIAVWVGNAVSKDEQTVAAAEELPGGLQSTQDGYTLALDDSIANAGPNTTLKFRILSASGAPVQRYVETHERPLHLIVVRNDLAVFQHVHPTLDEHGTWSVPLNLSRAGDYRVYADFMPSGGPALTLAANLHVAGKYDPQPLPPASTTAEVDGFNVTLNGTPKANEASMLTLSVSRDGKPVRDLQPYLGAYGHLVAIRASDLAYLHVHPMGQVGDNTTTPGPDIVFHTTFPSAGAYRLFLDFQHGDVVRTAAFTVNITDTAQEAAPSGGGGGGHQH